MTDQLKNSPLSAASVEGLGRRYRAEKRYRFIGFAAVAASLGFLAFLIIAIGFQGVGAFFKTDLRFDLDPAAVQDSGGDAFGLLRSTIRSNLEGASSRRAKRQAYGLVSSEAEEQMQALLDAAAETNTNPQVVWVSASAEVDLAVKAGIDALINAQDKDAGLTRLSDQQLRWIKTLEQNGAVRTRFNLGFLINGDSRDAERAGLGGAIMGSLFTLLICLVLSFFVGVMAAIYLEEFAPKNKWTSFLEININNLASVPSIIFGLLGLAVFLNAFGLARSSSLVGGMVLALMTLPTIIIASRVSLQAVPPSIREAALGLGATRIQAIFHHVVPLALPGMLTGAILGMARALGETAPLLMIGMVAFIADPPSSVMDPATALPVQVFLWSDSPERAFAEKTSGAILVLILFLILMNSVAILLRKKFEKKW